MEKIYNFQKSSLRMRELEKMFYHIATDRASLQNFSDGGLTPSEIDDMQKTCASYYKATQLVVNPFILTEDQKEQLLNVDVNFDELGEIHLPFDNFCIELGDTGVLFFDTSNNKTIKEDQNAMRRISIKLLYVLKGSENAYHIFGFAENQLAEFKRIAEGAKKRDGLVHFTPESLMNLGYKITLNELNATIADIEKAVDDKREAWKARESDQGLLIKNITVDSLKRMIKFIYIFCKFLESDNIHLQEEIIPASHNKEKIRELRRQGMSDIIRILKPVVILTKHQQKIHDSGMLKSHLGATHGFIYDVRGHFKKRTVGKLAGKHIWCPPHQRGLVNTVYKPAIRKV